MRSTIYVKGVTLEEAQNIAARVLDELPADKRAHSVFAFFTMDRPRSRPGNALIYPADTPIIEMSKDGAAAWNYIGEVERAFAEAGVTVVASAERRCS